MKSRKVIALVGILAVTLVFWHWKKHARINWSPPANTAEDVLQEWASRMGAGDRAAAAKLLIHPKDDHDKWRIESWSNWTMPPGKPEASMLLTREIEFADGRAFAAGVWKWEGPRGANYFGRATANRSAAGKWQIPYENLAGWPFGIELDRQTDNLDDVSDIKAVVDKEWRQAWANNTPQLGSIKISGSGGDDPGKLFLNLCKKRNKLGAAELISYHHHSGFSDPSPLSKPPYGPYGEAARWWWDAHNLRYQTRGTVKFHKPQVVDSKRAGDNAILIIKSSATINGRRHYQIDPLAATYSQGRWRFDSDLFPLIEGHSRSAYKKRYDPSFPTALQPWAKVRCAELRAPFLDAEAEWRSAEAALQKAVKPVEVNINGLREMNMKQVMKAYLDAYVEGGSEKAFGYSYSSSK